MKIWVAFNQKRTQSKQAYVEPVRVGNMNVVEVEVRFDVEAAGSLVPLGTKTNPNQTVI